MSTLGNVVGRMVVGMALDTAGLGIGLVKAEAQMEAFRASVSGAAQSAAAAGAARLVEQAKNGVTTATENLTIAELRLTEAQSKETVSAASVASAQAQVRRSTLALADAQAKLVGAELAAVNPKVTSNPFSIVSLGAGLASLAVLKFGEDATKASAQFEYDMRLIQTQAGATELEVGKMSEAILELAPTVQAGPDQLAKALFHIESVGINGAKALDVLRTAAQGAAVGNANLESVTNALIAANLSGIKGVEDMASAMGTLNGIVGTGNLRMQDLATSFSSGVLSTAKQFGLSLQDVGAAIATMADQGIPAEEAATRLRITIALIGAPTKTAERELARIGLTSRSLADQMRGPNGLIGALTLLKGRMDQAGLDAVSQSQLLKNAFGGSRSSAGILTLINSLELMGRKQDVIKTKSQEFLSDFQKEAQTAAGRFRTFDAVLGVLQIRIGNGLLPYASFLATVLGMLAHHTTALTITFTALSGVIGIAAARAMYKLTLSVLETVKAMGLSAIQSAKTLTMWVLVRVAAMVAAESLDVLAVAETQATKTTSALSAALMQSGEAAGPLVAGLAGADGAMAATVESSGTLVAGLAGADGAMAATAETTGTVVAGLAGVDGAIVATGETTGALVVGLAGVDGAMVATATSTEPLVAGLAGVDGAQVAVTEGSGAVILGLSGEGIAAAAAEPPIATLAGTEAALAGAEAGVGAAAPVAATGIAAVGTAAIVATGGILLLVAAVVALGVALVSLVTKSAEARRMEDYQGRVAEAKARGMDASKVSYLPDRSQNGRFGQTVVPVSPAESEAQKKIDEGKLKDAGESDVEAYMKAAQDMAIGEFPGAIQDTLIEQWGTSMAGVLGAAATAGAADMDAYAKAIRDSQQAPIDAFSTLKDMLATALTPTQEVARNVALLSSKELADGLASGDSSVVAAAEALQKHAVERLDDITNGAYSAGQHVAGSLTSGFGSGLEQARLEVPKSVFQAMVDDVNALGDTWRNGIAPAPAAVKAAMDQIEADIVSGGNSIDAQAKNIVSKFATDLDALKEIGQTSGGDLDMAIAQGIAGQQSNVKNAISGLHTIVQTELSSTDEIAFLLASLTGADIVNGLNSQNEAEYEAAAGARKIILDQLDLLTGGAYSAGLDAGATYAQAFQDAVKSGMSRELAAVIATQAVNNANAFSKNAGLDAATLAAGRKRYQDFIDSLGKANPISGLASQARSDMTSAFAAIKSKAMEFFDALHDRRMQAIRDSHDHKNAILDEKAALNQKPVTAAQKALDFQMQAQEEFRLREAVRNATDPAARRDAILALQNFLAQKHIDLMQDQVDAAGEEIDAQKKKNDELEAQQLKAEDRRYQRQKKDFERELAALERFLKSHPKEWRKAQSEVLALLAKYGVSYLNAGTELGAQFVKGLNAAVKDAQAAAAALAAAGNPKPSTNPKPPAPKPPAPKPPSGYPPSGSGSSAPPEGGNDNAPGYHALGAWDLPRPELAWLHAREMVLPPGVAESVRKLVGGRGFSAIPGLIGLGLAAQAGSPSGYGFGLRLPVSRTGSPDPDSRRDRGGSGWGSGNTIVFQVGDEKLGEITDRALYRQDRIYGRHLRINSGSQR